MILTVTPNTGLDRVYFLPRLEPGRRQQATRFVDAMGGKGCDVSLILRALGEETVATGLAGGETGERMEARLRESGVATDFVWTAGESRANTVLIETETLRHTTIVAEGLQPGPGAFYDLLARIREHAPRAEAVAVCGSLPAGWPPEHTAQLVRAAGDRPVVVDASGPALRAALTASPAAVKPNRQELESVAEEPLASLEAVVRTARRLLAGGAGLALASLGAEGAVAVTLEAAWFAPPLAVEVVNPAGAGDGMVAILCLGAARGWPPEETLRQAVAVATAITTTPGTAECPAELARALAARVRVDRIA